MGRGSGSGGGGGSFSGGSSGRSGGSFNGSSGSRRSSSSSRSGGGININHCYHVYNNVRRTVNRNSGYGNHRGGYNRSSYDTLDTGGYMRNPYNPGEYNTSTYGSMTTRPASTGPSNASLLVWFICICAVWILSLTLWMGARGKAVTPLDRNHINIENTTDMIVDDLGWVTEDRGSNGTQAVTKAIDKFTEATGVQPLVMITDGINGAQFGDGGGVWEPALIDFYEQTFSDDGHTIICLATRNGSDDYNLWIYSGAAASTVIDGEQQEVIFKTFNKEWMDLNQDECDMIADTLTIAAKKFKGGFKWQTGFFLGSTVVFVIYLAYWAYKTVSDRRLREEREQNRHSEAVDSIYDQMTGQ